MQRLEIPWLVDTPVVPVFLVEKKELGMKDSEDGMERREKVEFKLNK